MTYYIINMSYSSVQTEIIELLNSSNRNHPKYHLAFSKTKKSNNKLLNVRGFTKNGKMLVQETTKYPNGSLISETFNYPVSHSHSNKKSNHKSPRKSKKSVQRKSKKSIRRKSPRKSKKSVRRKLKKNLK